MNLPPFPPLSLIRSPSPVVIYHKADFDGVFCREIAKKFLPDATLIGWDYGETEPQVPSDCGDLYILDLSVPGLMSHPRLTWIDHHKTAIEKYDPNIPGYRIDGVAACRLAWQWFTVLEDTPLPLREHFISREVIEPIAVRLAGEYDIWDKRDPDAEVFQHGLRSLDLHESDWRCLLELDERPLINLLLHRGSIVQHAMTNLNSSIIKKNGFTLRWKGLNFLACNAGVYNSLLFTAGILPEHDALLGFCWLGKEELFSVSLYHAPGKEHIDLSEIAKSYNGGGHRGACGFRIPKLPWLP